MSYDLKAKINEAREYMEENFVGASEAAKVIAGRVRRNTLVGREVSFKNKYLEKVGGKIISVQNEDPLRCEIKTHKQAFMGELKLKKIVTEHYGHDFIFKDRQKVQPVSLDMDKYKKIAKENSFYIDNYRLVENGINNKGFENLFYLCSYGRNSQIQRYPEKETWGGIAVPNDVLTHPNSADPLLESDVVVSMNNFWNGWGTKDESEKLEKELIAYFSTGIESTLFDDEKVEAETVKRQI